MKLHEAVEFLIDRGLPPIPVHGVILGECSCKRPGCPSPGKHPIGNKWQEKSPKSLDEARQLFRHHHGNIGACVADTPFVVLDFDGPEGLQTLAELELPKTLRARSGSGGAHLVFRLVEGQNASELTDRRALPGMDVKKRGQFLVHPSTHVSGGTYEWEDLSPIADLPNAIYQKIRKRAPEASKKDRARAYISKMPAAVSGNGGHAAAFGVARKLVQDFGLGESDCMELLREYNTRCDPPWSESELQHKYESARDDARVSNPVEDRPKPAAQPSHTAGDWRAELLWTESKNGYPKLVTHMANVIKILQHHPDWRGKIVFDEFRDRVTVKDAPWSKHGLPPSTSDQWQDEDGSKLSSWMRQEFHQEGFSPCVKDCDAAVDVVARDRVFHPVRQYLLPLKWDGKPRIEHLAKALGTKCDTYAINVLRWWLISAVARVMRPGCKADHVLILEGKTGIGKSKALAILAGQWFSDTPIILGNKDAYQQIRGKWIVELAELDSLTRASSDAAKAFFSSMRDDYRRAYGKREVEQKRQCVFAGTTNGDSYLRDPTGNRRYWPIYCTKIDHAWIHKNRDQIWAEVVHLYQAHELWYPSTKLEIEQTQDAQDERAERDPWENSVITWIALSGSTEVSTSDVLSRCLKLEPRDWTRGNQMRVGNILGMLGWRRGRRGLGAQREYVYRREVTS